MCFCGLRPSCGSGSAGGTPGEEACRGLTASLPREQLTAPSARAISHRWIRLWSEGREADPHVGMPTLARACRSRDPSRALPGAWLWEEGRDGQGVSSSFPARLGLVPWQVRRAGGQILLWIPLLPKGAEGVGEQTPVVVAAMPSAPLSLISAGLLETHQQRSRDPEQGPG